MKRPRSAVMLAGLAATAFCTALSGCASLNSPAVITTPYQAADGTNFEIPDTPVHLANFLVIGLKQGGPASVVGSVVNDGTAPVEVSLSAAGGQSGAPTTTTIDVPAGASTRIGPDQDKSITLPELPVEPGAQLSMSVKTTAAGSATFGVPVVRPVGYYASLTPSPTPSPTPSRTRRSSTREATTTPTSSPTS